MATGRRYVLRARAERANLTRRRILAAAREALFIVPFDELTLPLVAAKAEVTTQTVRNHFASKAGLLSAVSDNLSQEFAAGRREVAVGDTAAAASLLVSEYETYGHGYARLLAAVEQSPALAEMARRGRSEHQRWLVEVFGSRLPANRTRREARLAALYVATDVGTWRLLRLDLGHSQQATTEVMQALIDAVLNLD